MPYKDPRKAKDRVREKKLADPVWHENLKQYWREYYVKNKRAILGRKRAYKRRLPQTPEEIAAARRKYKRSYYATKSKNPEYNKYHTAYSKKYRAKLKAQILAAYGAVCACCGETIPQFLTPDHINGGGTQHLKRRGLQGIYLDIIREGFPKDKYRILCMNCNWGRSVYGVCPHASANRQERPVGD